MILEPMKCVTMVCHSLGGQAPEAAGKDVAGSSDTDSESAMEERKAKPKIPVVNENETLLYEENSDHSESSSDILQPTQVS